MTTRIVALEWAGTALGVAGALLVALNVPASGYGFVLFLGSSLSWTAAGKLMARPSLVVLNLAFTAVNLLGIYRWLVVA